MAAWTDALPPDKSGQPPERVVSFGPFQLAPFQKLLLEEGRPVHLGSRALDILIALVARAGEIVSRDELVAFVWPRAIVEESSLRVHITALRKVLGDGQAGARYIVNQPGRGYCFIAPIAVANRPLPAGLPPPPPVEHSPALPPRLVRMLGRKDAVAALGARLRARRFVTLVGPGGIGKTTVALAAADVHGGGYEHGAHFIDLSRVADPQLLASSVAAGLGLGAAPGDALARVIDFLAGRQLLLVLDNCEHLIDAAALLAETLLRAAPGLHLLATSREALRAEGEWLQRLPALMVPPVDDEQLGSDEALSYSAIELFVERATASVDSFQLRDRDVPLVASLCRRLDGNPLAIELAAARIDLFGLRGLSEQLDAHVLQLKLERRGGASRHETLGAMLEWSYRLLTPVQRRMLSILSVFPGRFPLAAAASLILTTAGGEPASEEAVLDVMVDLAAKSLLVSDVSGESVFFRLLELPRTYTLTQLKASGQLAQVARAHAEYVLAFIDRAAEVWPTVSNREWRATYGWIVDDTRAALAWAFSDVGDVLIGSSLAVSVWPLIGEVSPFDEPAAIERALAAVASLPQREPALEMRLNIALAMKLQIQQGNIEAAEPFNTRALELAKSCDNPGLEAEALMIMVAGALAAGDYRRAAAHHAELELAARRSKTALHELVANRMGSQVRHFFGDHLEGERLAELVLSQAALKGPMKTVGGAVDHRVSMRIIRSRVLWLQGFAEQAEEVVGEALDLAWADDSLALCQALSLAGCPVALWCGNTALARERIASFRKITTRHLTGGVWLPTSATIPWWDLPLAMGGEDSGGSSTKLLHLDHLVTVQPGELSAVAVARALDGGAGWCAPELLRVHGEQLLAGGSPAAVDQARTAFEQSLVIAGDQGALAWSLRSATSLARLLQREERFGQARALLEPIHARFSEGFETADLKTAAALLHYLASQRG